MRCAYRLLCTLSDAVVQMQARVPLHEARMPHEPEVPQHARPACAKHPHVRCPPPFGLSPCLWPSRRCVCDTVGAPITYFLPHRSSCLVSWGRRVRSSRGAAGRRRRRRCVPHPTAYLTDLIITFTPFSHSHAACLPSLAAVRSFPVTLCCGCGSSASLRASRRAGGGAEAQGANNIVRYGLR